MELPSKLLEQIAFNTRPKIEEHLLIIMDKSTHEEHLFQPLQTNNKQFKIAVTFLSAYNGIFNVTNENNKFYFTKSITDDDHYIMIVIPPGAYEIDNPVDILSFDNIFIETDIAQGMIFKGKRTGIIHNFTMDVDPGYKYIEKFRGGINFYMLETKDFISSINFKLKNENGLLVSFNGQSITFRLSIKEV